MVFCPYCLDTLPSAYLLRCFLALGFCPFFACSVLHIAASLLCLLYLQTRTETNFLQFGWSWKRKPFLKHPLCFGGQGDKSLWKNLFSTLSLWGINTSFFKYGNYWKSSNHPWIQVILYFKRSNLWQTKPFHFFWYQKKVAYSTRRHHKPFCFSGFSWAFWIVLHSSGWCERACFRGGMFWKGLSYSYVVLKKTEFVFIAEDRINGFL